MTATPNDKLLGLIKCTREDKRSPLRENAVSYCVSASSGEKPALGRAGGANSWHTDHDRPPTSASGSRPASRNVTIKRHVWPIGPRIRPTARASPPASILTSPTSGRAPSPWPTGRSTQKKNRKKHRKSPVSGP